MISQDTTHLTEMEFVSFWKLNMRGMGRTHSSLLAWEILARVYRGESLHVTWSGSQVAGFDFCFINIFPACQFSKWSQTHLCGSWGVRAPANMSALRRKLYSKIYIPGRKERGLLLSQNLDNTERKKKNHVTGCLMENSMFFLELQLRPWSQGHWLINAYTLCKENCQSRLGKTC